MSALRSSWILWGVAALFGAGCSGNRPSLTPPHPCTTSMLLEYADQLQELAAPELEAEYQSTQKAFHQTGNSCDRFRLALQLLTPEARFRDESRAARLLAEYLATSPAPDGGFRSLAKLLVAGHRKQWEWEVKARESVRKAVEEKVRADALKRQLEELKEIERLMNERQKR